MSSLDDQVRWRDSLVERLTRERDDAYAALAMLREQIPRINAEMLADVQAIARERDEARKECNAAWGELEHLRLIAQKAEEWVVLARQTDRNLNSKLPELQAAVEAWESER